MTRKSTNMSSGSSKLYSISTMLIIVGAVGFIGLLVGKGGSKLGFLLIGLPVVIGFLVKIFENPKIGLGYVLCISFFASGLARYVPIPWGLTIDIILFISILAVLFKQWKHTDWSPINNDLMRIGLFYFLFTVLELGNPEARSPVAWFYAMRALGFYQLMAFGLVFYLYRKAKYLDVMLFIISFVSLMGAIWGMRQKFIGTDAAEDYWLYVVGHEETHILFGELRTFSFYSDAGQFGASQAMMFLLAGIIAIGPGSWTKRIWYGIIFLFTFIGFGISGTRGALAVPAVGSILFLIMTKNVRMLVPGLAFLIMIYVILAHTTLFQNIEQVKRMRTGLSADNPSLNVRFRNQVKFRKYLATRPIGGGIGTAGFWGQRFSPGTFLAETATDSWFVRIWAETGVVGLFFHVYLLGFAMGKSGYIIWIMENQELRYKMMALYCSAGGIIMASYGNQVYGQLPTQMIMSYAFPIMIMGPMYERELEAERVKTLEQSQKNKKMTLENTF